MPREVDFGCNSQCRRFRYQKGSSKGSDSAIYPIEDQAEIEDFSMNPNSAVYLRGDQAGSGGNSDENSSSNWNPLMDSTSSMIKRSSVRKEGILEWILAPSEIL